MTQDPSHPPSQPPWALEYAAPTSKKHRVRLMLVIAVAVVLVIALTAFNLIGSSAVPPYRDVSLSDFHSQLLANNVIWLQLDGDSIEGQFGPIGIAGVPRGLFRTQVPVGTSGNWAFTQWILDHSGSARVTVNNNSSLLVNLVVPLIPWLLIFLFIWFFVFRRVMQIAKIKASAPANYYPPPMPVQPPTAPPEIR
jgi:ATP-dependent Zn protease